MKFTFLLSRTALDNKVILNDKDSECPNEIEKSVEHNTAKTSVAEGVYGTLVKAY